MEADGKGKGRTGRLALLVQASALALPWLVVAALLSGAAAAADSGTAGARQVLRFGGDADYPPYHFLDTSGHPDGFDVALARELARDLDLEPEFELGDWGTAMERLARGEVDVVPMFWSTAREERFLFSEPILLRHHALFGHYETPTLPSLDHLANARVAVQRAGLASETLREAGRAGVTLVELEHEAKALELVARREVDYALVPTGIGYHAIHQSALAGIVALSPPLLERKYVFAIAPGRADLLPAINGSLQRLREQGVQNRLYVAWIGSPALQPGPGTAAPRDSGGVVLAAVAVAVLSLAAAGVMARRRKAARRPPAGGPGPGSCDQSRLLAELRDAIQRCELGFALQPKIDLRSGRWLGAELLVRWDHPRLGALAPDDFVPAIERARAIDEMTLYLVRRGLEQCRDWPDTGDRLHLSINVSANDLADPRLVDAIIQAADGEGPGLMLEVTETEVMREPERVSAALPRLRRQGIRISVDDFGTGHSSLVNLRRLAPDELKIDGSFVRNLSTSGSDRAIVRATIRLAHELDAVVAAEGIEDDTTRIWLAGAGCDAGQGFGIARPMSPGEFVDLLRQQGAEVTRLPRR